MNRLIAFFGMVVSCTALLSPIGVLAKAIDTPHRPARLVPDWKVLTNTYWMVYPQNLPAFELQGNSIGTLGLPKTDPPTVSPLQDQTVYYIKGYDRSGYFWGTFAFLITHELQPALAGDTALEGFVPRPTRGAGSWRRDRISG